MILKCQCMQRSLCHQILKTVASRSLIYNRMNRPMPIIHNHPKCGVLILSTQILTSNLSGNVGMFVVMIMKYCALFSLDASKLSLGIDINYKSKVEEIFPSQCVYGFIFN